MSSSTMASAFTVISSACGRLEPRTKTHILSRSGSSYVNERTAGHRTERWRPEELGEDERTVPDDARHVRAPVLSGREVPRREECGDPGRRTSPRVGTPSMGERHRHP